MSKIIGWTIVAGSAVVIAAPFVHYGTLDPCTMLRKEIIKQVEREQVEREQYADMTIGPDSGYEVAGTVIGMALGEKVLEAKMQTMTVGQCIEALWRVHTEGLPK
ncbi:MAG: hypothetical protein AB7E70_20920 [Hyphomicrobiaceae bacterium]